MANRKHPRYLVRCPIAFVGEGVVGAGELVDISLGGCAVETANTPAPGLYLEVWILLPDSPAPLNIELAPVRWIADGRFGLEFIKIQKDGSDRLAQFVRALTSKDQDTWLQTILGASSRSSTATEAGRCD